jgi:hypothetical protein
MQQYASIGALALFTVIIIAVFVIIPLAAAVEVLIQLNAVYGARGGN